MHLRCSTSDAGRGLTVVNKGRPGPQKTIWMVPKGKHYLRTIYAELTFFPRHNFLFHLVQIDDLAVCLR